VGTCLGVSPEENPKILAIMQERRSMRGREVKGEGGRVIYHFLVPLNQEGIIFTYFPIQAPA
jgi:hypothetical protein